MSTIGIIEKIKINTVFLEFIKLSHGHTIVKRNSYYRKNM